MGRPIGERRKFLEQWAVKYGIPLRAMRRYTPAEIEQLERMAEHARATIFSTARWERDQAGKKPKSKPRPPVMKPRFNEDARVERMMAIIDRRRAA